MTSTWCNRPHGRSIRLLAVNRSHRLLGGGGFTAAFVAYLEWGSRIGKENSQQNATPPPNMPVPRWWWVCEAKPGSRVSAVARQEDAQDSATIPGPDEPLSFAPHIKPLFRRMDRESMCFVFDLWSHLDVSAHAPQILSRLENGTMPCDGAWPKERVELFRRWIGSGMAE